jgi:hypothetical protein
MVARAHQSWAKPAGPSKAFSASEAGKPALREGGGFDERNPPPHEDIPDHAAAKQLNQRLHPMNDGLPGDLAPDRESHRAIMKAVMEPPAKAGVDHTDHGGIPAFCARKLQAEEPSYLDLVGEE